MAIQGKATGGWEGPALPVGHKSPQIAPSQMPLSLLQLCESGVCCWAPPRVLSQLQLLGD